MRRSKTKGIWGIAVIPPDLKKNPTAMYTTVKWYKGTPFDSIHMFPEIAGRKESVELATSFITISGKLSVCSPSPEGSYNELNDETVLLLPTRKEKSITLKVVKQEKGRPSPIDEDDLLWDEDDDE